MRKNDTGAGQLARVMPSSPGSVTLKAGAWTLQFFFRRSAPWKAL